MNNSRQHMKKWREGLIKKGLCASCGKVPVQDFKTCLICRLASNVRTTARDRRYRKIVLAHYGGYCTCCGETEEAFLDLAHVNDDGQQHRKIAGKGNGFCRWLVLNNFPTEFEIEIQCSNCNQGKRRNGGVCPHKKK